VHRPGVAHMRSRGITLLFLDHGTRRGEGSASRPGRSLPPGKTRYLLYRRLGGPQGRSGQVRKMSPSPGFDSRTVQPVANRYTDYATRITDKVRVLLSGADTHALLIGTVWYKHQHTTQEYYCLRMTLKLVT